MGKIFIWFVVLGLGFRQRCMATVYTVGDYAGWDISTNLDSWVAGKSFAVGDSLLFQYSSLHSVFEVSKDAFDNCVARNAILSGRDGNTTITLSTPGQKYFICGSLSHCFGGMKLQVSVNGEDPVSPAPAPLAPEPFDQVPVSIPHPSSNINKPLPGGSSAGFLFSARASLDSSDFSSQESDFGGSGSL
ncbi:hypothetical protein MRB53_025332 [Persea americana]|uniref:Uncharacterized protein n=1 Tax=Persea americana TaxID=3435 RepID=A0ACC2LEZ9_PERAE|nr:hypothetical protein MRB53_025332 [Persea americana]